jgi:uncharacterized protein DUF6531
VTLLQKLFQQQNDRKVKNQSRLALLVLSFVMVSLLIVFSSQANSETQTWWHTSPLTGSGPEGTYSTLGEACQTCLYDHGFTYRNCYNWTGETTVEDPSPPFYGCSFYRPKESDASNYESIQEVGCAVAPICFDGQVRVSGSAGACEITLETDHKQPHEICTGNPIIVATGNKFQTEIDYQSQTPFGLSFVRIYNSSSNAVDKGIGKKWHHGFNRALKLVDNQAQVARSNGQTFLFNLTDGNWVGDVDIPDTLIELVDDAGTNIGWEYHDKNDNVELFNASGQLLSITNRAGQSKSFVYDVTAIDGGDNNSDTLDKVIGFGSEEMLFSYDGLNVLLL